MTNHLSLSYIIMLKNAKQKSIFGIISIIFLFVFRNEYCKPRAGRYNSSTKENTIHINFKKFFACQLHSSFGYFDNKIKGPHRLFGIKKFIFIKY